MPSPPSEILLDSRPSQLPVVEEENPDIPPGARPGVFQQLIFTSTWISPWGSKGLGMTDLDLKLVLGFPAPSRSSPLVVVPGFTTHFIDWPRLPDLPPELYDAYVQLRWLHRLSPQWGLDLGAGPGAYSDFRDGTKNAFRVPGYAAVNYTINPRVQLSLGAAYLDRRDLNFLPVGGIVWKPNDDLVLELTAPRPKISQRVYWSGASGGDVQDWIYMAGEFGGGAWAVERARGRADVLEYTDYRVLLGIERKDLQGLDGRLEIGYVFGRSFQYERGGEVKPSDALLLRGGVAY
jgi:hypothetical protein